MKPIRLMSGFFTVGVWTLLSRVLGFVREVLLLSLIGPGPVMDAFVAAFRLPNMFRRFFAEGAFNAAFIPMFAKKLEGQDGAATFARDAFNDRRVSLHLLHVAVGAVFGHPECNGPLCGRCGGAGVAEHLCHCRDDHRRGDRRRGGRLADLGDPCRRGGATGADLARGGPGRFC